MKTTTYQCRNCHESKIVTTAKGVKPRRPGGWTKEPDGRLTCTRCNGSWAGGVNARHQRRQRNEH